MVTIVTTPDQLMLAMKRMCAICFRKAKSEMIYNEEGEELVHRCMELQLLCSLNVSRAGLLRRVISMAPTQFLLQVARRLHHRGKLAFQMNSDRGMVFKSGNNVVSTFVIISSQSRDHLKGQYSLV